MNRWATCTSRHAAALEQAEPEDFITWKGFQLALDRGLTETLGTGPDGPSHFGPRAIARDGSRDALQDSLSVTSKAGGVLAMKHRSLRFSSRPHAARDRFRRNAQVSATTGGSV